MQSLDCGRLLILGGFALCVLASSNPASAIPTVYSDRTAFEALGTAVYNADFEEFDPDTTTVLETEPGIWYHKGISYHDQMMVVGGNYSGLGNNVLSSVFGGIGGGIFNIVDSGYDRLGLDILGESGFNVLLDVQGTSDGLPFHEYYVLPVTETTMFFGIRAGGGGQISNFTIGGEFSEVYWDNVILGTMIPEPSSIALVAGAIATLVIGQNRRRKSG